MEIISAIIGISALVLWLTLTYTFTHILVALLPGTVWYVTRYLLMTPLAAVSAAVVAGVVGGLLDWLNKSIAKELLFRQPAPPPVDPAVREKEQREKSFRKLCDWTNEQLTAHQEHKSKYQPKQRSVLMGIRLEVDMLGLSLRHCTPENTGDVIAYLFAPGAVKRLIEKAPNDYWLAYHLREALRRPVDGQPLLPLSLQQVRDAEEKVREHLLYGVSNKEILKQPARNVPPELLAEYVSRGLIMIKHENHLPAGKPRTELVWNTFVAVNEKVIKIEPEMPNER